MPKSLVLVMRSYYCTVCETRHTRVQAPPDDPYVNTLFFFHAGNATETEYFKSEQED